MNEFSTYEHAVPQRIEGRWIAARIGLVFLYVAVALAILLLGISTGLLAPLIALTPLVIWILVFVTWRLVSVEYEYSITSGILTFAKIYGNRSRHTFLEIDLRQASRIAPLDNATWTAHADKWHPEREYSAISSLKAPDIYFILFEHSDKKKKEKRRTVFYFEATAKALQICRFYNPSATVLTKVSK